MEFLCLTEPVLALCVEVDREACELRYADPFPESHHRTLAWRVGAARVFFGPCWSVPGMQAALRARGKPASPCSAPKSHDGSTLLRSAPSNKCTNSEWTDFMGAKF
jgi:hypothetical protein